MNQNERTKAVAAALAKVYRPTPQKFNFLPSIPAKFSFDNKKAA
jgi:hypothetical protein